MLSFSSITAFGLAALSLVEARPIPHSVRIYRRAEQVTFPNLKAPPKGWAYEQLEPYIEYHYRYLTVGCASQHNTSFFESCCHPRYAGKTDSDFDFQCSLAAHPTTKLAKEIATDPKVAAQAEKAASSLRVEQIASVSSASVASNAPSTSAAPSTTKVVSSSKPTPTVDSASIIAASKASAESAYWASESSVWSVEAASKASAAEEASKTAEAAKPSHTASSSSSSGSDSGSDSGGLGGLIDWITGGIATFYSQNGVAGACGTVHSDSDYIVAEQYDRYGSGSDCGRKVSITNLDNGNTITATVADECMGCENPNSLDLSTGAFGALGAYSIGELNIKWHFLD